MGFPFMRTKAFGPGEHESTSGALWLGGQSSDLTIILRPGVDTDPVVENTRKAPPKPTRSQRSWTQDKLPRSAPKVRQRTWPSVAVVAGLGGALVFLLSLGIPSVGNQPSLTSAASDDHSAQPPCRACENFGTTIEFVSTPGGARELARRDGKMMFVLHLSGDFDAPDFT